MDTALPLFDEVAGLRLAARGQSHDDGGGGGWERLEQLEARGRASATLAAPAVTTAAAAGGSHGDASLAAQMADAVKTTEGEVSARVRAQGGEESCVGASRRVVTNARSPTRRRCGRRAGHSLAVLSVGQREVRAARTDEVPRHTLVACHVPRRLAGAGRVLDARMLPRLELPLPAPLVREALHSADLCWAAMMW